MNSRIWRTLICLGLFAGSSPAVAENSTGCRDQVNSVATSDSPPWDVSTRGRAAAIPVVDAEQVYAVIESGDALELFIHEPEASATGILI